MMSNTEKAIRATLEYARQYDCRLSSRELKRRLITPVVISHKDLEDGVEKYQKELGADDKSQYFDEKVVIANKWADKFASRFSSIEMVAITGSVASRYPKAEDDIDLLIVTKKNSLWLTRLFLRMWVKWWGVPHRMYGRTEKRNELCFNLWLETDSLKLPPEKQNLKNAIDARLMMPIINKDETYERFMMENDWVDRYLAKKKVKSNNQKTAFKKVEWWKRLLNYLVFWPQIWWIKSKKRKELVNLKSAFFHSERGAKIT